MRKILGPVLLLLALSLSNSRAVGGDADDAKGDGKRTERLVRLCRVWGTVRYLHPFLAYKDIDWDAALVAALPRVEAARDDDEFRAAVAAMLDRLGDPGTRVIRTVIPPRARDEKDRALLGWLEKDVLAIHLDRLPSASELTDPETRRSLLAALEKASGVILDLRSEEGTYRSSVVLGWLTPHLPAREVRLLAERYLVHSGYRPQQGETSGGYSSAFQTSLPEVLPAAPGGKGKPIVFLVGEQTEIPPTAAALLEAGEAFLVSQGKVGAAQGSARRFLPLIEGYAVQIRTTELVGRNGLVRVQADAEVPAEADRGTNGPAFQKALALLRAAPRSTGPVKATAVPPGAWRADKPYPALAYPGREYRLLALFRFWNVIHYFYPYKDLLDQDWDTVLPRFVPRFAAARDARDYNLAVAEMAACVQDAHTVVLGKEMMRYFGEAAPPIAFRQIEGKPVVTDLVDADAAKGSGVAVGDVVVAIDGEPMAKRMARYGKYIAGSNPASHASNVLYWVTGGPDGSMAKLTLQGEGDKTREITLPRKTRHRPTRSGAVFKMLPDNIGYCDLDRLTVAEVDAMLERFKNTKAIIFDLRGYPQQTIWTLAPRLNVKGAKYAALFERPLVSGMEEGDGRFAFRATLDASRQWQYQGRTVTLIDERAISQAEHSGLFLEVACATTFIGSPTAGANGDITDLTLPGGILIYFTGHDVRHSDGRQLQRIGLTPHIEVRPTIAGIRAGQDEVLARALPYLREGK